MRAASDDWDQHWQDYAEIAQENPAQNYRREMIFSLLDVRGRGDGMRILDIGSGQGDMVAAIRGQFPDAEILGLELARSGVEISQRKVPTARFVQRDLLDQTSPSRDDYGWATHAICSEVIEHLDDPALLLRNARAYMREGCSLIVTVPGGPMSAFDKHIGHRKHWLPQEIEALLREAGYMPEHAAGVGFPFFNLYRCLVVLRGKKLIADVTSSPDRRPSFAARAAMAVFFRLIRPNLNSSHRGWQIVAKARVGGSKAEVEC